MADVDRLIGFMEIMQVPFMNAPNALAYIEEVKTVLKQVKAQEPRVMDAQELKEYLMINESGLLPHEKWKELEQRAPVYIEFRTPNEFQVNWRTVDRLRPWAMESMFWDSYNKDRRCWTSRPSDSERGNTPWED